MAAELSRRGLIAKTFTGNVPYSDIIASDEIGRHVSVQVKASRGSSWQFGDITRYCSVTFEGKRQVVGDVKPGPVRRLIFVLVRIGDDGDDRFCILPWKRFCALLADHHREFLARNDGMRPGKWDSLHSAIDERSCCGTATSGIPLSGISGEVDGLSWLSGCVAENFDLGVS